MWVFLFNIVVPACDGGRLEALHHRILGPGRFPEIDVWQQHAARSSSFSLDFGRR
jgi:hypothetical protein